MKRQRRAGSLCCSLQAGYVLICDDQDSISNKIYCDSSEDLLRTGSPQDMLNVDSFESASLQFTSRMSS